MLSLDGELGDKDEVKVRMQTKSNLSFYCFRVERDAREWDREIERVFSEGSAK